MPMGFRFVRRFARLKRRRWGNPSLLSLCYDGRMWRSTLHFSLCDRSIAFYLYSIHFISGRYEKLMMFTCIVYPLFYTFAIFVKCSVGSDIRAYGTYERWHWRIFVSGWRWKWTLFLNVLKLILIWYLRTLTLTHLCFRFKMKMNAFPECIKADFDMVLTNVDIYPSLFPVQDENECFSWMY